MTIADLIVVDVILAAVIFTDVIFCGAELLSAGGYCESGGKSEYGYP
jgi:hypothetical protein